MSAVRVRVPIEQRFWSKVDKDGPTPSHAEHLGQCWVWTGGKSKGYGSIFAPSHNGGRRTIKSHRFAYESLVGPVPAGLQLDHLCHNTACVNPAHLEPVTSAENTRRLVAHRRSTTLGRLGSPVQRRLSILEKLVATGGERTPDLVRDLRLNHWRTWQDLLWLEHEGFVTGVRGIPSEGVLWQPTELATACVQGAGQALVANAPGLRPHAGSTSSTKRARHEDESGGRSTTRSCGSNGRHK